MKLYHIAKWNELFENNRSRTVSDLTWVKVPNRHDGENYSLIIAHPEGSKIFSAWVLILQVASRCRPRGTLIRDTRIPHTPQSLSVKTRAPVIWFEIALDFIEKNTDWFDVEDVADGCQVPDSVLTGRCQSSDEEWKEGNGMERREDACQLLDVLNRLTGSQFRQVNASILPILARLAEPGVTVEGVQKMIERQVKLWKNNPEMSMYLRPSTLFRPSNFNSYYAAREQPVRNHETNQRNSPQGHDRNAGTFNEGKASEYEGAAAKTIQRAQQKSDDLPGLSNVQ